MSAPSEDRPADLGPAAPPRTDIEEQLLTLWSRWVQVRPLGVQDQFFALGGDSLAAIQLVAAVQRHYGIRLDRVRVFEAFTVESMAELVGELR
jgi:acyl carrier protein